MKIIKFIFLLFFLLGIVSCKKTESTSAKVTVIDKISQKRAPNIKVVLTEIYNMSWTGSAEYNFNVLKIGYTDANGQFDFGEFVTQKKGRYTYSVDVGFANPNGLWNIGKGKSNDIIIEGSYFRDVSINFLPPPPYNIGDSLSVNITNADFPNNNWTITNNNYSLGYSIRIPSGYDFININKYKSGVFSNIRDTVSIFDNQSYDVYW